MSDVDVEVSILSNSIANIPLYNFNINLNFSITMIQILQPPTDSFFFVVEENFNFTFQSFGVL